MKKNVIMLVLHTLLTLFFVAAFIGFIHLGVVVLAVFAAITAACWLGCAVIDISYLKDSIKDRAKECEQDDR